MCRCSSSAESCECGGHGCQGNSCGGGSCGNEECCGCCQCEGCGGGSCGCGECGGEEGGCSCQCHENREVCDDCRRSGHKVKFLVMKAFKKMLVSRLMDRMEKKYGKKLDKVADLVMEKFEQHMKIKKEMMEAAEFDLEEKIMETLKE